MKRWILTLILLGPMLLLVGGTLFEIARREPAPARLTPPAPRR